MDKVRILEVNNFVFEYILGLKDSEIEGLINGSCKLILEEVIVEKPKGSKSNIKANDKVDEAIKILKSSKVREDGIRVLSGKGYTIGVLKEIAKLVSVYINPKGKKQEMIEGIVEGTIGHRNNLEVLRKG